MNKRFVGVLTFAFLVAAGASLVLYRVLINRPTATKAGPAMAHVVLATKDLEVGTVLKEDDVKLSEWPGALPVGAATEPKTGTGTRRDHRDLSPRSRSWNRVWRPRARAAAWRR